MWTMEFLWLAIIVTSFGCRTSCEKVEPYGMSAKLSADSKPAINKYHQNLEKLIAYNKLYAETHFRGHMGCTELRSKRYISDGQCTSPRPIFDTVCAEWCLKPAMAIFSSVNSSTQISPSLRHSFNASTQMLNKDGNHRQNGMSRKPLMEKWRCTEGLTKRRKVKLLCRDGSRHIYHVRVVSECKCSKQQEQTMEKSKRLPNGMERIQKLT